jgi:hypothetical protein
MSSKNILALLSIKASEELKILLENKHLYQGVNINPSEYVKQQYEKAVIFAKQDLLNWSEKELPKVLFTLVQQQVNTGAAQAAPTLALILPHPGLYCQKCKRREAFAPVWYTDVSSEIRLQIAQGLSKQIHPPAGFQMFFLVYQCQHCLGRLEGFLVRREGWNLGLHGRSPIELVEVPAYVPDKESWLYKDAVIAFNSGKVLAALFYLRTFVEQFARRVTGLTERATGEEILSEYYKMLPAPTKDQMPSLREWYEKLSEALHAAREDSDLFGRAKAEIERHFDIRRVFKMPEQKPVEPDKEKPAGAAPAATAETT